MIRPKGTAELEERTGKNAEDFLDLGVGYAWTEEDELEDEAGQEEKYIRVIGEDRKIHRALPWETKTKCGCKIIKKGTTQKEEETLYSCYECTY